LILLKRVLLIGKLNDITKELSELLAEYCQVQLCTENLETIRGMLNVVRPDLTLISLVGTSAADTELFSLVLRSDLRAHVVIVGNDADEEELRKAGYLRDYRVYFIRRPVRLTEVSRTVKELLSAGQPRAEREEQKTVLMVDDNPTMLRTLQSMLSKRYKVMFATSGAQAITAIAKQRPDVILLDYEMPVCDGKKTLEMLRSEEETRDIPVVFLTGMAEQDHVREVLALQPQGYLLKPPSNERLFATIEEALGGRKNAGGGE